MGCAKTIAVICSAVLSTVAAGLLSYLFFPGAGYLFKDLDPKIQVFPQLAAALIIAAAFGLTLSLLLVWNAGGKLAALGVLFLGLLGELVFLVVLLNFLTFGDTFLYHWMTSSTSHLVNGLNIAFGAAGLFTKRRPG